MQKWASENGYQLPPKRFFDGLTKSLQRELRDIFQGKVVVVSEGKLRRGMNRLAKRSPHPVISLDRAYVDGQTPNVVGHLDLTRLIDHRQEKLGLAGRDGVTTVEEAVAKHGAAGRIAPATLIDDVIFGGDTNVEIAQAMRQAGRPIPHMIAGITIREGGDKLRAMGITVRSVKEFRDVVDEVCERDFFAGVPFSGKVMKMPQGGVTAVPYFLPFANPDKLKGYSSVARDNARRFSEFCLEQSATLWEGVEQASGKRVPTNLLPHPIAGLPQSESVAASLRDVQARFARQS
jgi:hypothetical protein